MGDAFGPPRMCLAVPRFTSRCPLREKPCVYELDRRRRKLAVERFERGQKLVRRGGEVADASSGRIVDGVDDRSARPADAEVGEFLASARATMRVGLVEKHRIDRAEVGVASLIPELSPPFSLRQAASTAAPE